MSSLLLDMQALTQALILNPGEVFCIVASIRGASWNKPPFGPCYETLHHACDYSHVSWDSLSSLTIDCVQYAVDWYFSGATLALSVYRDTEDAFNYIGAGGVSVYVTHAVVYLYTHLLYLF